MGSRHGAPASLDGMDVLMLPAASLVGLSLLLGWISHASVHGGLDRNGLIGIRTRATMASDEAWRAGHRAAASSVGAAAWTSGVAGLAGGVLAVAGSELAVALVAAGYAALIGFTVVAAVRAGRAARAAEEDPSDSDRQPADE